jgi:hypothetical protein
MTGFTSHLFDQLSLQPNDLAAAFWPGRQAGVAAAHRQFAEEHHSDYQAYQRVQPEAAYP